MPFLPIRNCLKLRHTQSSEVSVVRLVSVIRLVNKANNDAQKVNRNPPHPAVEACRGFADSFCLPSSRKLYWLAGDDIIMANTDGSNSSVLFINQKGPVGE